MPLPRFSLVALDCPDPRALAEFYSRMTGWPIEDGEGDWVQLDRRGGATIAFQKVANHVAPDWPGPEQPQQLHLDFDVDDLDEGERLVLDLGARKAEYQPADNWRVYLDPAGHPFCLVLAG
ncbi:MAG: VOC family protein [Acidimicrobiia bacterium]|nr:VOC family protein [Acidimicrobiia bacterium]